MLKGLGIYLKLKVKKKITISMLAASANRAIYVGKIIKLQNYEGGSKSSRPDIQKPRQMENAARYI